MWSVPSRYVVSNILKGAILRGAGSKLVARSKARVLAIPAALGPHVRAVVRV